MIDKREVRYGNLVFDSHYEQERTLGSTDIYEIGMGRADHLCPIDLSEYWLERLGENYSSENNGWQYRIRVGALSWYFRWNTEWYSELGGIYLDSKIKHLHQVQNIFFDFFDTRQEALDFESRTASR